MLYAVTCIQNQMTHAQADMPFNGVLPESKNHDRIHLENNSMQQTYNQSTGTT